METGRPLEGIRVVTLEQAVAAPLCTRHLAELGADVVKIERPGGGDFARVYDSAVLGQSTHFVWLNRNKRSLAVDLKQADGLRVLLDLVAISDVLVWNVSPAAMSRLIDVKSLVQDNPGLVCCGISGYGSAGPYRDRKAFDLLIQGEAGVTRNTGTRSAPAKPGVSLADLAAGVYALAAITAALAERARTRRGRVLEISLFDAITEWMMPLLLAYKYEGAVPEPAGMHHATIAPYGPFRSADDKLINIAVQNHGQWFRLCREVLEDEEMANDPRYRENDSRVRNRQSLETRISEKVRQIDAARLQASLEAADVPWGDLNDVPEVITHPQLTERARWIRTELPDEKAAEVLLAPFLQGNQQRPTVRVPRLGEHTVQILKELRYESSVIASLEEAHVIESS